jgi:hypothetical protein
MSLVNSLTLTLKRMAAHIAHEAPRRGLVLRLHLPVRPPPTAHVGKRRCPRDGRGQPPAPTSPRPVCGKHPKHIGFSLRGSTDVLLGFLAFSRHRGDFGIMPADSRRSEPIATARPSGPGRRSAFICLSAAPARSGPTDKAVDCHRALVGQFYATDHKA